MRTVILTAMTMFAAGCGGGDSKAASQGTGSAAAFGTAPNAKNSGDWLTEVTESGLDGRTHSALRTYAFPDMRTRFDVAVACTAASGVSELTVDSIIGDPNSPDARSGFITAGLGPPLMFPVGRAKASDGLLTDLKAYFELEKDYTNRLVFKFHNPVGQKLMSESPGYSAHLTSVGEGDINYAKLLLAALPLTIEVKNGAGVFEIEIDESREVVKTLEACGASKPAFTAGYVARAKAAEEDVSAEVVKNVENICGYRGVVRETSEEWMEKAKGLSISLECAQTAPAQLAVFNQKIDGYMEKAHNKGLTCSRDALLKQAAEAGLDDSFLWDSYLENYCRG